MKPLMYMVSLFSFLLGGWLASSIYAFALGQPNPGLYASVFVVVDIGVLIFLMREVHKKLLDKD